MRSSLQPTLFVNNNDFRGRFKSLSNHYACELMLLNLEFLQMELASVSKKMTEVDCQFKRVLEEEKYKNFVEKQSSFLLKFKNDLQEVKRKKWLRDQIDYENGFDYAWSADCGALNQRRSKSRDGRNDNRMNNNHVTFLDHRQPPEQAERLGEGGDEETNTGKTRCQKAKARETRAATLNNKNAPPPRSKTSTLRYCGIPQIEGRSKEGL